jgi:OmpA-OmpF porin, OOP family
MHKILITAASIAALLLSGCASQPSSTFETFQAQDLNGLISSGQYTQKANNFFVINDSSSSMTDEYFGVGYPAQPNPTKFLVEKEILSRINQTIPDLSLTSSIRSFGFGDCLDFGFTKLNQAPTSYSRSTFASGGIDALTCASGGSPMGSGIDGTNKDLSTTTGNIAVLILSDGHDLDDDGGITALQSLKQVYGDRLCVYSVWVGNEDERSGIRALEKLTDIAGCGYGVTADSISSPENMAKFVTSIFLKGQNAIPECSTLDGDKDGVNDCDDLCPTTLPGVPVSIKGCWIVDVKFDFDKYDIKPQYFANLDNTAQKIKEHPEKQIEVQGHTDNVGSFQYNQKLSERRADAVKKYLIEGSGRTDITSRGFSFSHPIDTNETEAGRANNRRVQLEVEGQPQFPLKP